MRSLAHGHLSRNNLLGHVGHVGWLVTLLLTHVQFGRHLEFCL